MATLTSREQLVLGNIEEISETIGNIKYFVFSELVDFDLDNSKEELKVIVEKLQREGYLNDYKVWMV